MAHSEIYLFLKAKTWEFHAVEAAHSDEALMKCLKEKAWDPSGLIYLGHLEGALPPRGIDSKWNLPGDTPDPTRAREPHATWKFVEVEEVAS